MIVDLFAGGGGASTGIEMALGRSPSVAVNHDRAAIAMHEANHPATRHFIEDVWNVNPHEATRGERVKFLWLSPDCTHFSRARGKAPRSQKTRSLAEVAFKWDADVYALENVKEFTTWGPLLESGEPDPSRSGEFFRDYVREFNRRGYVVDWTTLRASDYGAATTRERLAFVARRDGRRIKWPTPTTREPRSAASIIDWHEPVPSIFGRSKPFSPPTLARIAEGIRRFGNEPYLIHRSNGERIGQAPRVYDIAKPLGTFVAQGQKHALVFPFISKHYSMRANGSNVSQSVSKPLGAITTIDHHALVNLYTSDRADHRSDVAALLAAHGLEQRPEIVDIGMRWLTMRELYRASSFPESYVIDPIVDGKRIGKTAQCSMVGNAVPPVLAEAVVRAQMEDA